VAVGAGCVKVAVLDRSEAGVELTVASRMLERRCASKSDAEEAISWRGGAVGASTASAAGAVSEFESRLHQTMPPTMPQTTIKAKGPLLRRLRRYIYRPRAF
jgi:hypothetical protein